MFLRLFVPFNTLTHKRHHMMRSCRLIIAPAERNIPARVKSRKWTGKQDEDEPGGMRPLQSRGFSKSLSEALRTRRCESLHAGRLRVHHRGGASPLWCWICTLSFSCRRHVSADGVLLSLTLSASFFQTPPSAAFHGHGPLISRPPLINLHSPKHNRLWDVWPVGRSRKMPSLAIQ